MNDKNKFAVLVSNTDMSELCQRLAFSFGYEWPAETRQNVAFTLAKYLVFYPGRKEITWTNNQQDITLPFKLITSINELLKLLKDPPKESIVIELFKNGTVKVDNYCLSSNTFDEIVNKRIELLGRESKQRLPIAKFSYTSKSSGRKDRMLAVMEWTAESLGGLDMLDYNKFKRFLFKNVQGGIYFDGFTD